MGRGIVNYSTISQIGGFTALSEATTDWLRITPDRCTGGADADVRTNVEDAPGANGVLVLPALIGQQIITLGGDMIIRSSADGGSGMVAARDTLLAALKVALGVMMDAPANLVHSGGTLSCWKYSKLDTSYANGLMAVTFGLVVA